ncbi:MAG: sigma 54-interacting transcriptional regulator [Bacteroidales bacterium]|nr:sigma 54-interacting transcriptional regulator [Bacteroidales bacterium]
MSQSIPKFTSSDVDEGFTPEDARTKELYKEVGAFARQGQPILIFGPTGAGKEFLARHYYNTLIKADFFQQYRDSWPAKYEEIRKKYAACYSKASLNIFLASIRAGVFQSINSATIYPSLAESILFGHEANVFNDARTSPGLLESIKYGVLFLDEIGELSKDLQAKLLRAIDSEIAEGRRIGGKMDYSLKDIIIISATNQPRTRMRQDFYYKLGMDVEINSIDKRPDDVRKAIPHFIGKAIGKRKDYAAVTNMFGLSISDIKSVSKLSEADKVRSFAKSLGEDITDDILMRRWPGNFRALRRAIESAVLRIDSPDDLNSFSEKLRRNLKFYIPRYSEDAAKTIFVFEKPAGDAINPSPFPDLDTRILEELNKNKSLRDIPEFERSVLAVFLSSNHEREFTRKDLGEYYKRYENIRHTSEAHIRNRINKLIALRILGRSGTGKSTRYHLTESFLNRVFIRSADIFSLPALKENLDDRSDEINALRKFLLTTERVCVTAPTGFGKTVFIAMFSRERKKQYNFYYYCLSAAGIRKMFEDIVKLLQSQRPGLDADKLMKDPVHNIHPYLGDLFMAKEGVKPVLILDNVYYNADPDGIRSIVTLARIWREVIIILISEKMDNAFEVDFHEFQLCPYS